MTMPECQPEPEPPSTSSLPVGGESPASPKLHWHVLFEPGAESVPEDLTNRVIERCCHAALSRQKLMDLDDVPELEISVQLLDTQKMRELNLQYRHKDSPTNVLSFASDMPLMEASLEAATDATGGGLLILGDLVLCPDVIAREASEQSKKPLEHWAHMLVHGTLHLCGYDHENEHEAQEMEAIEILVLSGLGISDPYAVANVVNER